MVNRLSAGAFLGLSLFFLSLALIPVARVVVKIDESIGIQFWTMIMLLIGGLMAGLTAMILLMRRQAHSTSSVELSLNTKSLEYENAKQVRSLYACGLLLYTGVPLLNFLVAYWIWKKHRNEMPDVDRVGREVLDFQITIYLYLLLSLFLVFAVIGLFTTPIILLFHFAATIFVFFANYNRQKFHYLANIPITLGRRS